MKNTEKKAKAAQRRSQKHQTEAYKDHITNLYMLHLTFGILGIILITFYGSLYKGSLILHMNTISWVITGIFAVSSILLLSLGKTGKVKNTKRAYNYSILLWVCTGFGLWFSLFNKLRMVIESVLKFVTRNDALSVNSYWIYRLPIILIVAYLIVFFIVYVIKIAKK